MPQRWVQLDETHWWVSRLKDSTAKEIEKYGPACDKRYAPDLWPISEKLYQRLVKAYAELNAVFASSNLEILESLQDVKESMRTLDTDPEIFVTSGGKLFPAYKFCRKSQKQTALPPAMEPTPSFSETVPGRTHDLPVRSAFLIDDIRVGLRGIPRGSPQLRPDAELSLASVVEKSTRSGDSSRTTTR